MARTAAALAALMMSGFVGLAEDAQSKDPSIIGDATMTADRTIIIRMRRTTDGKNVSGTITYAINNPHYKDILKHLGGMNPGDTKLVPAWPDVTRP